MVKVTLVEAPQSHAEAKKNVGLVLSFHESSLIDTCQALIRDGYRCAVTGKYDARSVRDVQELKDLVLSDSSLRREVTECAYIFAESTNSFIEPGSASAKVCTPIYFFLLTLDNEYPYIAELCWHDVGAHESLWS